MSISEVSPKIIKELEATVRVHSMEGNHTSDLLSNDIGVAMYDRFMDFPRRTPRDSEKFSDIDPENKYTQSALSGYTPDGLLIQLWSSPDKPDDHLLTVGDVESGAINSGPLYDVLTRSGFQSRHGLQSEQESKAYNRSPLDRRKLPPVPAGDFSDLYGRVDIDGVEYALYASPELITLTDSRTGIEQDVFDLVDLSNRIQYSRKLGKNAIKSIIYI